jgi:hypothetical protein
MNAMGSKKLNHGLWELTRMDLLDFVIRMLGLALQVLGLLLTFTAVRSLAQLRLKAERAPGLRPHSQGFHSDNSLSSTLGTLAKSDVLIEPSLDRDYGEPRSLSAVTLQRLTARAGWGVVVVGIGTLAGTLSWEIAQLLGALYRLLIT